MGEGTLREEFSACIRKSILIYLRREQINIYKLEKKFIWTDINISIKINIFKRGLARTHPHFIAFNINIIEANSQIKNVKPKNPHFPRHRNDNLYNPSLRLAH